MLESELKEKYPLVYERILEEHINILKKYDDKSNVSLSDEFGNIDIHKIFVWERTVEGHNFWSTVNREDWDIAKKLQPNLFEESNNFIKIVPNGLFKN